MHRLNIGGDHLELRQLLLQPRQRGAQLRQLGFRTQHEAQHHAAVERAFGQQQVLQLAAFARHVIRRQARAGDKAFQHRKHRRKAGGIQRAVAQIDRHAVAVQHAEQRALHAAADHHLGFIAKCAQLSCHRLQPLRDVASGQQRLQVMLFVGQLLRIGLFQPLTGTAGARRIQSAMHEDYREVQDDELRAQSLPLRAPKISLARGEEAAAGGRDEQQRQDHHVGDLLQDQNVQDLAAGFPSTVNTSGKTLPMVANSR